MYVAFRKMARCIAFSLLISLLLFGCFGSTDLATLCKSTPFPSLCRTLFPTGNVTDGGRIVIGKSIELVNGFQEFVDGYLRQSKGLTVTDVRALNDCKFLGQLSIDYLWKSSEIVNDYSRIQQVASLISAVLTNTEACNDALQLKSVSPSVRDGVLTPLLKVTALHRVTLALVSKISPPIVGKEMTAGKKPLKLGTYGSVDVVVKNVVVVNQDGSGDFDNINDAVNAAPENSDATEGFFVIRISAGVYEEYITIPRSKKYVMMIGDGVDLTIITGSRSVADGWTTVSCATFTVVGEGFVAMNVTFRNTAGAIKQQAVAVFNMADRSAFYRCSFQGYQDTLSPYSLRQFYSQCDIYGTIDFIFGNAAAVFQDCNIYLRRPLRGQFDVVAAQGRTDPNQNTGFAFQNCNIRAADDADLDSVKSYLGRPWKKYSRAIYMESFVDKWINPAGWSVISGDYGLSTSYFAEYNNFGPGSDTSRRVNWPAFHVINSAEAENFTVLQMLSGDQWLPETEIPYREGL